MTVITMDIQAIAINGVPMLDGYWENQLVGLGTVFWQSLRKYAVGEITKEQFCDRAMSSVPTVGYCNTKGTASITNCMAEVLGLLFPAFYRERLHMAYVFKSS